MDVLIVPVALVLLALAAIRFGHDSRDAFAPAGTIRPEPGYREVPEEEPAFSDPVRPSRTTRLAPRRR